MWLIRLTGMFVNNGKKLGTLTWRIPPPHTHTHTWRNSHQCAMGPPHYRGFTVTHTHQTLYDSSRRVINPKQRPLPDTQHGPEGIRTRNPSSHEAQALDRATTLMSQDTFKNTAQKQIQRLWTTIPRNQNQLLSDSSWYEFLSTSANHMHIVRPCNICFLSRASLGVCTAH